MSIKTDSCLVCASFDTTTGGRSNDCQPDCEHRSVCDKPGVQSCRRSCTFWMKPSVAFVWIVQRWIGCGMWLLKECTSGGVHESRSAVAASISIKSSCWKNFDKVVSRSCSSTNRRWKTTRRASCSLGYRDYSPNMNTAR